MRRLTIVWQRVVTPSGATCDRCGHTLAALQRAVTRLKDVLRPLDLEPILETVELTQEAFNRDPSASNRVWIGRSPTRGMARRASREEPLLFRLRRGRVSDSQN